jgi:uncharacterized protein
LLETAAHDTASTAGARRHARSLADSAAPESTPMPRVPASGIDDPPAGVPAESVVWDEVVGPGGYGHRVLAPGTAIRLLDVEGDACANIALFNALDPWERLNVADTVKVQWQAYLGPSMLLLSDQGRALCSVIADTSATHDALCSSSTRLHNEARYGDGAPEGPSPCARDLLTLALAKHGLGRRDLGPTFTFFKGCRVGGDGTLVMADGAGAGAEVTLRSELPLVVAIANVPHPLDPRTHYAVTPLRITAWRDRRTAPTDPIWSSSPEVERALLNTADYLAGRSPA